MADTKHRTGVVGRVVATTAVVAVILVVLVSRGALSPIGPDPETGLHLSPQVMEPELFGTTNKHQKGKEIILVVRDTRGSVGEDDLDIEMTYHGETTELNLWSSQSHLMQLATGYVGRVVVMPYDGTEITFVTTSTLTPARKLMCLLWSRGLPGESSVEFGQRQVTCSLPK